jgi:hypothetical protein
VVSRSHHTLTAFSLTSFSFVVCQRNSVLVIMGQALKQHVRLRISPWRLPWLDSARLLSCTNLLCIAHNKCTRHTILFFYFGSGGFRDCTYFKAVGWKQNYWMEARLWHGRILRAGGSETGHMISKQPGCIAYNIHLVAMQRFAQQVHALAYAG